jgi:hypothetical protein
VNCLGKKLNLKVDAFRSTVAVTVQSERFKRLAIIL